MSAPQLIAWLEQKLAEHGVAKVIPPPDIMREQAQRVLAQRAAEKVLKTLPDYVLPDLAFDLEAEVRYSLQADPELSWDTAVSEIVTRIE